MAVLMTKEEWMQTHFTDHFHDKVNKQALLELSLGINTIIRPDDPLNHGFEILIPCKRAPLALQSAAPHHESKIASVSTSNVGLFSTPSHDKAQQPEETHTPTKKR